VQTSLPGSGGRTGEGRATFLRSWLFA